MSSSLKEHFQQVGIKIQYFICEVQSNVSNMLESTNHGNIQFLSQVFLSSYSTLWFPPTSRPGNADHAEDPGIALEYLHDANGLLASSVAPMWFD